MPTAVCVKHVEIVCNRCGEPDRRIFSCVWYQSLPPGLSLLTRSSRIASLDGTAHRDRIPRLLRSVNTAAEKPSTPRHLHDEKLHRFEETINGRAYEIEVSAVRPDRWRANLVTLTGGPTALMPFYGSTPAEAADLLVSFLARAHRVASNSA